MTPFGKKYTSLIPLAVLFTLAAVPKFQPKFQLTALASQPVLAQATTALQAFKLPQTVAQGTKVAIDGSSSMETINAALKQRFEKQYPGTQISVGANGAAAALQALRDGKVQLAAIGRPLTAEEKAEGLVAVPIARHKIAMVVGPNNPFKGSLTVEQFAKIFRGEVTNWAQVGGPSASVRLVDRPNTSDTRQAFQQYPVFQKAPFQAGSTALQVDADSTTAVIEKLGADGVGYAIADQVLGNPGIQTVSMHNTSPDNPKYPFSQPLSYVYKGPEASQVVKDFLGYVTTPENQAVIETARSQAAKSPAAISGTIPEGAPAAGTMTDQADKTAAAPDATATPAPSPDASPTAATAPESGANVGGTNTGGANAGGANAGSSQAGNSQATSPSSNDVTAQSSGSDTQAVSPWWWLLLPLVGLPILWAVWPKGHRSPVEDGTPTVRDSASGAISTPDIDADRSAGIGAGAAAAGLAAAGAAGAAAYGVSRAGADAVADDNRLILVPRNCKDAYAYWELSDGKKSELERLGQGNLALRLYEVTDINLDHQPANSMEQFDCDRLDRDMHLPIALDDRDYLVELGYTSQPGDWVKLARSEHVRVPKCGPAETVLKAGTDLASGVSETVGTMGAGIAETAQNLGSGAVAAAGAVGAGVLGTAAAAMAAGKATIAGDRKASDDYTGDLASTSPPSYETEYGSRIVLVPRNANDAYAYWEVSDAHKAAVRQQGGKDLKLRLYDVTDGNWDTPTPNNVYEFDCNEQDRDRHLPIRNSDHEYLADLGYVTDDGRWLSLTRSRPVQIISDKNHISI